MNGRIEVSDRIRVGRGENDAQFLFRVDKGPTGLQIARIVVGKCIGRRLDLTQRTRISRSVDQC